MENLKEKLSKAMNAERKKWAEKTRRLDEIANRPAENLFDSAIRATEYMEEYNKIFK